MITNIEKNFIGWGKRVSYTILDQGFFSGSNFIVSLLLARYIDASAYGVFSITYSIFLFISGIYNSLVLEPINVLGPKNHDNDLLLYKKQSIKLHFLVTGLLTILGLICTLIFWLTKVQSIYIEISLVISFSFPFILFFWLARQCAYLETKPRVAFYGSVIYAMIYIGFFLVLVFTSKIQVGYIFVDMALASTVSGLIVFSQIGVRWSTNSIIQRFRFPTIIKENWLFGRWILFSSLAYGISSLIYSPLIGFVLGVEQAGIFRGMQNFFQPFTQVVTGLSLLITPYLSRKRFTSSEREFKTHTFFLIGLSLLLAIVYSGIVLLFASPVINAVYNNSIYDQNIWIIPYLGISTIFAALDSALGVFYRVKEKTFIVFYGKIAGAIAVLVISLPMVEVYKMRGALVGLNISLAIEAAALILFGNLIKKPDKSISINGYQ